MSSYQKKNCPDDHLDSNLGSLHLKRGKRVIKRHQYVTCTNINELNIIMAGIDRAPLCLAKDAKNSVSLDKRTFQPRSTPAKPASSEALLLLIINQKSAFQANQGFTCLLSLSGFEIGLRKSFVTKSALERSALVYR